MIKLILYPIIFCAGFVLYVRYLEAKSLFYPAKELMHTPEALGLKFEDAYFTTSDAVKLHGWFIAVGPSAPTLLFMHGNAGNIGDRLGKIQTFYELGLNVFIFDYRGFGNSEGKPTEAGMYRDTLAAYDYLTLRKDINTQKIVAYGASLGGAAAIDVASQRPVAGLVVDSSFSNAADMAKFYYPFVPAFLLKIKLENDKKIKAVKAPSLFFHSSDDETVPYDLGQKLFESALPPKTFVTINGGHNDGHVEDVEVFIRGVKEFLEKHKIY